MNSVKTHSPGPLCNGEDDTLLNIARPQLEFEALFSSITTTAFQDMTLALAPSTMATTTTTS